MEKHTSRKCRFQKCQGISFHCPHGKKPIDQVWLWRSLPPPHYCLKGQRADFSHCLGLTKIYNLVLCLCITWEQRNAPAALQPCHSTAPRTPQSSAHPHRFSLGGHSQRNYAAVSTQSRIIQATWRRHKTIVQFLLNKQSLWTQKSQTLSARQHVG